MSFEHEQEKETEIYSKIYDSLLDDKTKEVDMIKFKTFFEKSNIQQSILNKIYNQSLTFDSNEKFTRLNFGIFCKFVTLKLNHIKTSEENLFLDLEIPEFFFTPISKNSQIKQPSGSKLNNSKEKFYKITEELARSYVSYIFAFFKHKSLKRLDDIVLKGNDAKSFFKKYKVPNKFKKELWHYLDKKNEFELSFIFIFFGLHFLNVFITKGIWILDVINDANHRDAADCSKYLNEYLKHTIQKKNINQFFMSRYDVFYKECSQNDQSEIPNQDEFEPKNAKTHSRNMSLKETDKLEFLTKKFVQNLEKSDRLDILKIFKPNFFSSKAKNTIKEKIQKFEEEYKISQKNIKSLYKKLTKQSEKTKSLLNFQTKQLNEIIGFENEINNIKCFDFELSIDESEDINEEDDKIDLVGTIKKKCNRLSIHYIDQINDTIVKF